MYINRPMLKFTSFFRSGDSRDAALIDFLEANRKSHEIALLGALMATQKPSLGYAGPQLIWPTYLKKYFELLVAEFDELEAIAAQNTPLTKDQLARVIEIESLLPDEDYILEIAKALFGSKVPTSSLLELRGYAFPGGDSVILSTSYGRKVFMKQFNSIYRQLTKE